LPVRALLLLIAAALLAEHRAALAAADPAYARELIERAAEMQLARRPQWHKLLHYVPNHASPGFHSLVDSPDFFLSPHGKRDPRAELEATLAGFFSVEEETAERQNPQCAFIARRAWLDAELGFDRRRLPQRACKRYSEWHAALNPAGLTLVFPAAYINNPSSMYGHTLLRVDAKDQDERTRLLAYAVNFAANTNETNGLVFAVNGLFGGYAGNFSLLPYYLKVREYSDLESRDIWEYELDLAPDEVERVLMHAWELLPAYFQYFFFDENCSYHLLRLLQVARPGFDFAAPFRWWALPSDTVKAVTSQPGLLKKAVYRPAVATVIGHRLGAMSAQEKAMAKDLSTRAMRATDARLRGAPPERAAAVLEAAHDYVNYRRASGKQDVADPAGLARELLVARSAIDAPPQTPVIAAPPTRPDQGHGSSRAALGAGRQAGRSFVELSARATYHDIMDLDEGFVRGAQIEFFSFAARQYSGSTRLERFIPVDIVSLSPRDEFFQPWSWKIGGGWRRMLVRNGSEPLVATLDGGVGGAWSALAGRLLAYALLDAGVRVHGSLAEGYGAGGGGHIGALFDALPRWRLHGYARTMKYMVGENDQPYALALEQRLALGRDLALRMDLSRSRQAERSWNTAAISVLYYF
jgi:hypothetical protein